MSWNIDEEFYPGPPEESPNLVPNPLSSDPRIYLGYLPPSSPNIDDLWIDASSGNTFIKMLEGDWKLAGT